MAEGSSKKTAKGKSFLLAHKEALIAVIAICVMLIIYFAGFGGNKATETQSSSVKSDYKETIQNELKSAVIKISGDKSAEVVIGWDVSGEIIIANTTSQNGNNVNSTPTVIQTSDGASPIVLKEIYPKSVGAAVICKECTVKKKIEIVQLVADVLGLSADKVAVYDAA